MKKAIILILVLIAQAVFAQGTKVPVSGMYRVNVERTIVAIKEALKKNPNAEALKNQDKLLAVERFRKSAAAVTFVFSETDIIKVQEDAQHKENVHSVVQTGSVYEVHTIRNTAAGAVRKKLTVAVIDANTIQVVNEQGMLYICEKVK